MRKVLDAVAIGAIVFAYMAAADWRYRHPGPSKWLGADVNDHLGAENDDIARAIRAGRGFSDPFGVPSGPTAWMGPVLPYTLAGLYWVGDDDRQTVVECVLVIKFFVLLLTGLIVSGECRRIARATLGYAIFTAGLALRFHPMFQRTHDEWMLLLVIDLMWLGAVRLGELSNGKAVAAIWGVFGGFAALCTPVAGATWGAVTVMVWFPWRQGRPLNSPTACSRWMLLLTAVACSMITVTPWTVRNRLLLGKWIPIKSNCVFEIWQSQCVDDDGVLDAKTLALHPWTNAGPLRGDYVAAGEAPFIAQKWPAVQEAVRHSPTDLFRRVGNRFLAACLWYPVSGHERQQSQWVLFVTRAAFPLPFLCLPIVLSSRHSARDKHVIVATCIYTAYLCPYVLISYYDRYSLPLMGVKMLLVVHAFDELARAFKKLRKRGQEE